MANTKKYLSHLLQNTGITPACSEEERAAADVIAKIFTDHGFTPEVQEFSASGTAKVVQAALGIAVFIGAVLMGIGGPVGVVGMLLALAAAVLFVLERSGKPILSALGSGGLSQNVIAYHRASGPLASPRNRPVVVVAHYDSPREDLLAREPFAAYKPIIVKLLPFAMVAPAVIAVVRMLPVPGAAKAVLWVIAILASLIPLANGVAIIANRFVLPYTTGSVSNKSSVAAMLGVMDAVAPYELGEEFPHDTPADEYFDEQQRILEEAIAAAEAAAAAEAEAAMAYPHELEGRDGEEADGEDAETAEELGEPVDEDVPLTGEDDAFLSASVSDEEPPADDLGSTAMMSVEDIDAGATISTEPIGIDPSDEDGSELELIDTEGVVLEVPADSDEAQREAEQGRDVVDDEQADNEAFAGEQAEFDLDAAQPEPRPLFHLNDAGNVRFGGEVIRGLGMLPDSCSIMYDSGSDVEEEQLTAFEVQHEDDLWSPEEASGVDDDACESDDPAAFEGIEDDDEFAEADVECAETDNDAPVVQAEDADGFDGVLEAEYEVIDEDEDVLADNCEEDADMASDDMTIEDGESADGDVDVEDVDETSRFDGIDVEDDDEPIESVDLSGTVAMPVVRPVETVDSLMAQIDSATPVRPQRPISVPSTADAPQPHTPQTANRASLFDLPDPSAAPLDPFATPAVPVTPEAEASRDVDSSAREARSAFTVISSTEPAVENATEGPFETIHAPAPVQEKPRRGLSRFFGRKKKNDDSMSDWLGVDDSFDAKSSGSDIGSWDNFDDDWKGGAAGYDGATEEEMREAIADMGDEELLGHDIWFVATGASESGNAGVKAFLDAHRDKLRGVFLINLESVGAGQLAMLATEGEERVLKGDKRIMKLVQQVSSDFHRECATVDMPYVTTDAHVAMEMSLRSLTIGGIEGTGFALSHTEEDQPYNVDTDNVAFVSDVVTEVIRRS